MTESATNRRLVSIFAVFVGVIYLIPFLDGIGIIFDDGLVAPSRIASLIFAVLLVIFSGIRFFKNSLISLAFCGICSAYFFTFELISDKEPALLAINLLITLYFLTYVIALCNKKVT